MPAHRSLPRLLAGAVAGAVAAAAAAHLAPAATASEPAPPVIRFDLPVPTGSDPVGLAELHPVDRARPEPWVADPVRELVVTVG